VMLIEARGRAGDHLKAVVRQAERAAPGAFLSRMRGEVIGVDEAGGGLRVWLRSGRVLEVGAAVVATGSLAASELDPGALPPRVSLLPSDASPDELHGPVDEIARAVLSGLDGPAVEPPSASAA